MGRLAQNHAPYGLRVEVNSPAHGEDRDSPSSPRGEAFIAWQVSLRHRRPWRRGTFARSIWGMATASGSTGDPYGVARGRRSYVVACLRPKKGTCGHSQMRHIRRDD
jgi:hypothetical protein